MKSILYNRYYKEQNLHKNFKYKYRITYVGSCVYQLTFGKYNVLYQSFSLRSIYNYIIEHNINLSEVHMPYITFSEFLSHWASF